MVIPYCEKMLLGDAVIPRRGKAPGMKIFHRHHFSSALKRMSVVAGYTQSGTGDTVFLATVKGAPETLESMVKLATNYYYHVCRFSH
jgi:cation-transporting ATPase 13A1